MTRALGADYSHWQDDDSTPQQVDFEKAKNAGLSFVFIKVSQQVADSDYLMNWHNAKLAGLPRGGYHYLDWRMDTHAQAKLFSSLLMNDPGELNPILDLEMKAGAPDKDAIEEKALDFLQYVEQTTGKLPGIYTGYYFWRDYTNMSEQFARYPLWLAWYAPEVNVIVPEPWDYWTFWQYTSKGDGHKYGAESLDLDMNLFKGTVEELEDYADVSIPTPPVPTTSLYFVNCGALNVRSTPTSASSSNIIGYLSKFNQIAVDKIQGNWAHFIPQTGFINGGWVYKTYISPVGTFKTCPTCGGTGKVPA
jgi:lysozyme